MLFDSQLFDSVSDEAKSCARLRMAKDLRDSPEDNSQRMLNAIEPGTVIPIHRHRNSSETCIVLKGKAEEFFYDDNGEIIKRIIMEPGSTCCGINIEAGTWHKIVSLEKGTIIFEAKDGKYEPLTDEDILKI